MISKQADSQFLKRYHKHNETDTVTKKKVLCYFKMTPIVADIIPFI